MSIDALSWVMNFAPVENQGELAVLYALADRASDDGTAAWPSQNWLAYRARCTDRTVRNHLKAMEDRGLIYRGDQRVVAHLPVDRRPVVWNLNMSLRRDDLEPEKVSFKRRGREENTGGNPPENTGGKNYPPENPGKYRRKIQVNTAGKPFPTNHPYKPSLEPGGVTVLPKVTDTHAREENPLEDFLISMEEPPLRGDTDTGFNESNSISEGEVVVSEPDHPWSESAMLNHRPEHLKTVAEKYAKKPHASRCPVHEHADRSVPCQSCKQVRLYAEEIADRLDGRHSEQKARRKQEINACRLCDPRGMASYVLPDGSPQAVTCLHSSQWFDEFVDEVSERFLADRAEEQRQRELRQQSRARDEAMAKVRGLRGSRFKAS